MMAHCLKLEFHKKAEITVDELGFFSTIMLSHYESLCSERMDFSVK